MCASVICEPLHTLKTAWPVCQFDVCHCNKGRGILPLQRDVACLLINVVLLELIWDVAVTVVVLIDALLQLI